MVAALVGQPKDDGYAAAADAAFAAMVEEARATSFLPTQSLHRRGTFPAVNVGVTHGKDAQAPVFLNNHQHTEMMDRLLGNASIQRLAAFASGIWRQFGYGSRRLPRTFCSVFCYVGAQRVRLLPSPSEPTF